MNIQAKKLNETLQTNNPAVYNLLSQKGKEVYFPKEGILTQSAEAKGAGINATIGEAVGDDKTPLRLSSMAEKINLDPKLVFPYAPGFGKPELRKIWLEKLQNKNPSLKSRVSLPVVTSGITHALSIAGYLFIDPGNKIFLPDKYWDNYQLIFENGYGAVLETFNTFKAGGLDILSFKEKLEKGRGKKIVLLTFPNNPAGYTPTVSEMREIIEIIRKQAEQGNNIAVLCDDAYAGLVYEDGIRNESVFADLAGLHENILAIKIDGATKEDCAWGLRVGFLTYASKGITGEALQALETKTAAVVRATVSNASHLSQSLLLESYAAAAYECEKKEIYELLRARFRKTKEILCNKKYSDFFSPLPYNSGYFLCLELRQGLDAEKIRQNLLNKYNTGVIAVQNMLRIAFSSVSEQDMEQLFKNIYQACQKVKND